MAHLKPFGSKPNSYNFPLRILVSESQRTSMHAIQYMYRDFLEDLPVTNCMVAQKSNAEIFNAAPQSAKISSLVSCVFSAICNCKLTDILTGSPAFQEITCSIPLKIFVQSLEDRATLYNGNIDKNSIPTLHWASTEAE